MRRKIEKRDALSKARQVKRWTIPTGYCLEKGKIMPNSIFFSDKAILKDSKKTKIVQINTWTDGNGTPTSFQFFYENELGDILQGVHPVAENPENLTVHEWQMTEGDYLAKLKGQFIDNELIGITFQSRFNKKKTFRIDSPEEGHEFKFQPRPDEIPSCLFGAYSKNSEDEYYMCHIGCQFMTDW